MDVRGSIRKAQQARASQSGEGSAHGCVICMTIAAAGLTVLFVICLILALAALGIAKLVIGGIYFHDCDLQPLLPIFLIVDAVVGIVVGGSSKKRNESDEGSSLTCKSVIRGIAALFMLAWLICGTVWVVQVRSVIYSPDHCKPTTKMTTTTLTPTTTTTAAATTATDITTLLTDQTAEATTPDTPTKSLLLSTLMDSTNTTKSSGDVNCKTCSTVLVDFTFVVVILQLILSGLAILIIILSLLVACLTK